MSKKLVIFGTRQIAEVLGWYFTHDSDYQVVAYTVDADYLAESSFQGSPVVAFEEVSRAFPPDDHAMFVALSYAKMNRIRAAKYAAAKAAGYRLASHISPRASGMEGFAAGRQQLRDGTQRGTAILPRRQQHDPVGRQPHRVTTPASAITAFWPRISWCRVPSASAIIVSSV